MSTLADLGEALDFGVEFAAAVALALRSRGEFLPDRIGFRGVEVFPFVGESDALVPAVVNVADRHCEREIERPGFGEVRGDLGIRGAALFGLLK